MELRITRMKRRWRFLWPFVIVIALLAISGIKPVSCATTTTSVAPPVSSASVGHDFTIDIDVAEVPSAHKLYAFYINLSFDPDVLLLTDMAEGDFLADQPEGTTFYSRVEQARGWVYFGYTTKGAYDGVDGDGTLARVTFNATALGESPLNITNPHTELIEMAPVGGGHVPEPIPSTLENGYFSNLAGVPPVAEFTYSPDKPAIDEAITFNASDSYDPDVAGYIVSFMWDFGDGTTVLYVKDVNFTMTATHAYTTGGSKSVMLTVTDDAEMEDSETKILSVKFAHDVAVTDVQLSTDAVAPGESVSIDATVLNKGSSTETFTLVASYDGEAIGQETVSDLAPDGEDTVSFVWDTSGVAEDVYAIRVNATGVTDDGNLADNVRFAGNVDVTAAAGLPMEYIIIAVVVIIIIVVGVFAYSRRGR